jgi:hypothetical protein
MSAVLAIQDQFVLQLAGALLLVTALLSAIQWCLTCAGATKSSIKASAFGDDVNEVPIVIILTNGILKVFGLSRSSTSTSTLLCDLESTKSKKVARFLPMLHSMSWRLFIVLPTTHIVQQNNIFIYTHESPAKKPSPLPRVDFSFFGQTPACLGSLERRYFCH